MSQFNAPIKRTGGGIDVYTGLLCAAFLVLVFGVVMLLTRNIEHSAENTTPGGIFKLVEQR